MIIVRLTGRLGNQLFQYAFALSEQKRIGAYAVIDDRFMRDIVSDYFTVKGIFRHKLIKKVVFKFNKFPIVYQDGPEDVHSFIPAHIRNSRYYYAYFQSEEYFKTIQPQIRERFRIKQRFQTAFEKKYGSIFKEKKVLAIHYRFGDYVNWSKEELGGADFTLPDSYYINALSQVPDLEKYFIILVTDDVGTCDNRTRYLKNKLIVSDSEIMDFQILLNADKLIIANSTFSWWAAYLNRKDPQVFAPQYWLGFKVGAEFPNGILPRNFVKVNVRSSENQQLHQLHG